MSTWVRTDAIVVAETSTDGRVGVRIIHGTIVSDRTYDDPEAAILLLLERLCEDEPGWLYVNLDDLDESADDDGLSGTPSEEEVEALYTEGLRRSSPWSEQPEQTP